MALTLHVTALLEPVDDPGHPRGVTLPPLGQGPHGLGLPRLERQEGLELRRRKVGAPKIGMIEMFVLVLFLVASIVSVISCFVELARLLDSDAIGHVAAKALQGGG